MIYTIGHKQTYLKAIQESDAGYITKLGKRPPSPTYPDGYAGGYAFLTFEDALRCIRELDHPDWYVWGLDTTWDNTEPAPDGWWHNLIEDARIINLEKAG